MKILKWIVLVGAGLFITQQSYAQKNFSYDLYGVYATRDKDGSDDDEFGLGVGVNYFFDEHMGVGLDSYAASIDWPYMLNASFIYRLSQVKPVTPYAFAGFGRQWEHAAQWTGHIGGGAEFDLRSGTTLFADARLVLADKTSNYGVVRVGVRLGF